MTVRLKTSIEPGGHGVKRKRIVACFGVFRYSMLNACSY